MTLQITPLRGLPEVGEGDELAELIRDRLDSLDAPLGTDDILCVAQKIVSKAEGRYVDLESVTPGPLARNVASRSGKKDPREIQVILNHSRRIIKMEAGVIIAETPQGFVCANAGVDRSNVPGSDRALLLPVDPDQSARRLRAELGRGGRPGPIVVITDTWGRPWREGQVNFAIGVAGMNPLKDYRGGRDVQGRALTETHIAVADECAAAAELVMGKTDQVPAVVLRGYTPPEGTGSGQDLIRPPEEDFFR